MTPAQLKAFCEAKNLTQKDLAQLLGTSPQNITNWIKGKHDIPTWVEKELFRTVKIPLPIEDLHSLVEHARREHQPLETILAAAIRAYLSLPNTSGKIIQYPSDPLPDDKAAEDGPE